MSYKNTNAWLKDNVCEHDLSLTKQHAVVSVGHVCL